MKTNWVNKLWDELTATQKTSAIEQYVRDTGDEARFANSADWYTSEDGDVTSNPSRKW